MFDKLKTIVNLMFNLDTQDIDLGLDKVKRVAEEYDNVIQESSSLIGISANEIRRIINQTHELADAAVKGVANTSKALSGNFYRYQQDFKAAFDEIANELKGLDKIKKRSGTLDEQQLKKLDKLVKLYGVLINEGKLFVDILKQQGIQAAKGTDYRGFKQMIQGQVDLLKYFEKQYKVTSTRIKKDQEELSINIGKFVTEYYTSLNSILNFYRNIGNYAKGSIGATRLLWITISKIAVDMFSYLNKMDTEYHKLVYGVVSDSNELLGRSYALISMTNTLSAQTGLQFEDIKSTIKAIAEMGGVSAKHFRQATKNIVEFSYMTNTSTANVAKFVVQLEKLGGDKGFKTANHLLVMAASAMKKFGLSAADIDKFMDTVNQASINLTVLSKNTEQAMLSIGKLGEQYLAVNSILKKTMGGMKELQKVFTDATSPVDALSSRFLLLYARTGALADFIEGKSTEGLRKVFDNFGEIDKQIKKVSSPLAAETLMRKFAGSTRAYLELRKTVAASGENFDKWVKEIKAGADIQQQFADATHNLGMILRRILLPILQLLNAAIRPFIPILKLLGSIISQISLGITKLCDALERLDPTLGAIIESILGIGLFVAMFKFHGILVKILLFLPKLILKLIKFAASFIKSAFGIKRGTKIIAGAGDELQKGLGKFIFDKKKMVSPIASANEEIKKHFSGMVTSLKEHGGSFVKNLKDKITTPLSKLGDSVKNIGKKAVGGIKNLFGIGAASATTSKGVSQMGSANVWKGILAIGAITLALIALFWAINKFNITPAILIGLGIALVGFAISMKIMSRIMIQVGKVMTKGIIYIGIFILVISALGLAIDLIGHGFKAFGEGFKLIGDSIEKFAKISLIKVGLELVTFMSLVLTASAIALFASFGVYILSMELLLLGSVISKIDPKPLKLLNSLLNSLGDIDTDNISILTESIQSLADKLISINADELKNMTEASEQIISFAGSLAVLSAPPSEEINKSLNSIVDNIISNKRNYEEASEILRKLNLSSVEKTPTTTNMAAKASGVVGNAYSETKLKLELNDTLQKVVQSIESNTSDIRNINGNIDKSVGDINDKMRIGSLLGINKIRWL